MEIVVFRLECHEIMVWIGLDWKYGAKKKNTNAHKNKPEISTSMEISLYFSPQTHNTKNIDVLLSFQ